MMKLLALLILSLTLFACTSTTKENNYYSLNLESEILDSNRQDKKIVVIKPIQLAAYLNVPGLVMQLGKYQIVTASHHLWAEPLERELGKLLQQKLNKNCEDYSFETKSHYLEYDSSLALQLEIDKFHATDQSTVEIAGRFWLMKGADKSGSSKRFSLSNDLDKDGYLHMVKKLNQTVTGLSKVICSGIKESQITKG